VVIDPRLQIAYLLAVGVAAFATSSSKWLVGLLLLQLVLWLALRLPVAGLVGIVRRLQFFIVFVVVSFALFEPEAGDRLVPVALGRWVLDVNLTGLGRGLLLSSRIVTVIAASQILQRAGGPDSIVQGLRGLRVPASVAYSLDLLLGLVGGDRARGGGDGQGRRRGRSGDGPGALDVLRRMVKGDVGFLVELMQRSITRARERADGYGLKPDAVADLAVIGGLGALAMTMRFLKILPGLPFAPGHKGVVLLPFYIVAYDLTASRWGATQLGVVIGVTSFLMGEGKFGPFEVLREIAPGLFVDLVMPLVRRWVREPGALLYALVGTGAAMMRLSTLLVVAYLVEAPSAFYAFLVPTLVSNTLFGFLSGFVTFHVLKSIQKLKAVL
jgi:hypothetical protein